MILRSENLLKKYKTRIVANNVSVQVAQGEIVGLLGPNGAGKTTTFYMIVGLIKPNEGKIFLDNEDITNLPMYERARKGLGYLAQEASVFRTLTVEENILSVLQMTKMSKKEQLAKVEEMLEEFSFLRVHNSYIVNLNEISKYIKGDGGYLTMSDGSVIDVSRSRKEILIKRLYPVKD